MLKFQVSFFLILGLFVAGLTNRTGEPSVRLPQSVTSSPNAGIYSLVNGTERCPSRIEWVDECQGFALNIPDADSHLDSQKFCHLNKGAQTVVEKVDQGYKRILSQVSSTENVIRKHETSVFINKKHSASLFQEDTVIIDETGKFLWEHSRDGRGFSCLYTK